MAGLTWLDAAVVAWVLVSALIGLRRGLVLQTLSLVGFAIGAIVGSRLAPHLLENGERAPWLPVASLLGAVTLGTLAQAFAGLAALPLRKRVVAAGLGPVDAAGGLLAGTAFGLALAWLIAVVAVQSPGLDARDPVRRSTILPALIEAVPPRGVLRALARFDPLPVLPGIATDLDPPDPRVARSPFARSAALRAVKIEGTACGLGVSGSGWPAAPGLVVTNAHVVAGQFDTRVETRDGRSLPATLVYLDTGDDVALLRVTALALAPIRMAPDASDGEAVVLVGYPGDGPLRVTPGRAGGPRTVIAPDATGTRVAPRVVIPLRGSVRHGHSGGPVLDRNGRVVATMFAAQRQGAGGFGVANDAVREALRAPHDRAVDPGRCAG
jgi:S1-C subfamily serine protease